MSEVGKVVSICHKIYRKGYVSAYDGNVSLITPNNTVLFTRSGVCKGDVTEEDILEFDMSGSLLKGEGFWFRESGVLAVCLSICCRRPARR